jgi:[acyl-carrier-protein] S-malonyltransferase
VITWVFPGQGSQFVGMAEGLDGPAGEVFAVASEALGWDVLRVCSEGPEERMNATEVTQPAIFTASVAASRTLMAMGLAPDLVAGHSVGEFAALTVSGALSLRDAVQAVAIRAEAMRRCGRTRPGGMAAVIGLPPEEVEALCVAVEGDVGPANYNAPDQVVVSGEDRALAEAAARARAAGARVIRLRVSIAAHSALMQPARDRLAGALQDVMWSPPLIPVVSGVTGRAHEDAEELAELAVDGVTSPVRWLDCVRTLGRLETGLFVEVGPGEVLSGLIRRTIPEARTVHVGDRSAAVELADRLMAIGGSRGSVG